jgi:ribosome-associated protein
MTDDDNDQQTKSERKRQMLALQKLGEILVGLPEIQLKKIPLENPLLDAVYIARSLKSHEAKRRQLQYIGKLMRQIDPEPIQTALDKIHGSHLQSKAQFQQIERWRDKLIEEGDIALEKFLLQYTSIDRQHLRRLIRKAQDDIKKDRKTGGETELFRYLRSVVIMDKDDM